MGQCLLKAWPSSSLVALLKACLAVSSGSPGMAQARSVCPVPSIAPGTMPKLCSLQGCSPPACWHCRRCSAALCWWCPHPGPLLSSVLVPGAGRASLGWSTGHMWLSGQCQQGLGHGSHPLPQQWLGRWSRRVLSMGELPLNLDRQAWLCN